MPARKYSSLILIAVPATSVLLFCVILILVGKVNKLQGLCSKHNDDIRCIQLDLRDLKKKRWGSDHYGNPNDGPDRKKYGTKPK